MVAADRRLANDPSSTRQASPAGSGRNTPGHRTRTGKNRISPTSHSALPPIPARTGHAEPDLRSLLEHRWVMPEPIVYEDFLPRSAAGIFQSNLTSKAVRTPPGQLGADIGWMSDEDLRRPGRRPQRSLLRAASAVTDGSGTRSRCRRPARHPSRPLRHRLIGTATKSPWNSDEVTSRRRSQPPTPTAGRGLRHDPADPSLPGCAVPGWPTCSPMTPPVRPTRRTHRCTGCGRW